MSGISCKAIAALFLAMPMVASAAGFMAGAARMDITPPVFNAAADAAAFPTCPAAVFTGPRPFAFEEPYIDSNGDGRFSYGLVAGGAPSPNNPEPFCDANANGRWDGIFISGGVDHQAKTVHDPIDVRAIAISDGSHALVIESAVAQGIFIHVIDRIRARAKVLRPGITDVIVSANHNESSPDTVGIYGAPDTANGFGGRSGIDDYYIAFLVEQAAQAAVKAYDALQPATLRASRFALPPSLQVRLSVNFPTTNDAQQPAAVDFLAGVLQARDAQGRPIFTMMNLAAHNQQVGHSSAITSAMSSDWPGYFHNALEASLPGLAMFLVGDNGSLEDPETIPQTTRTVTPSCNAACLIYTQAQATGEALAAMVVKQLAGAQTLTPGPVAVVRSDFFVPIENNLFKTAARSGLFGDRPTYTNGVEVPGQQGNDLKTTVAVASIGPDLQLLTHPGEAFPALIVGSPWGIEEVGCPMRANPSVPNWHARAPLRFQVGLANDLIGYLIPAWAYSEIPGVFAVDNCYNDPSTGKDPAGHKHKLESEGLGPTASNAVADQLTLLLDQTPDPMAEIRLGRYLHADGSADRKSAGAVAIWLAAAGSTSLAPGGGTIIALDSVAAFGTQKVNAFGSLMNYNGAAQDASDLATRGMVVAASGGTVSKRYYLNLYPRLTVVNLPAAVPRKPDAFSFIERSRVPINSFVTSEVKTMSGFSGELPVSISEGGQLSINDGAFSSGGSLTIAAGNTLQVRHVSASLEATAKSSLVSVGSFSTEFKSITTASDVVPEPFSFGSKTGQAAGALIESELVTPKGFDTAAAIVAGPDVEYRINGAGSYTRANGRLQPGQALQVRHTSNGAHLGYTKTYLKVGGVSGYFVTRTR